MKIIDLLNKIANGEEVPKKIYYFNRNFYLKENTYFGDTFTLMHYIQEEDLNDTVEILEEENKIEKIDKISINNISHPSDLTAIANMQWENNDTFRRKINEIIDEINKLKEN